ncbi:MAG TPA: phytanoyl-CoA dioxygenase family protein [Tepidisphaeraceae bacterium]|nr:phytanoyl-CoA dioxygenase family protein [Tepidisphaeraceae bacterium]
MHASADQSSPWTPEALAAFWRDGFIVARQLLSPAEVAEVREAFMAQAKDGPVEGLSETRHGASPYDPGDPLARYPRMMHPHRHPELPVGQLALRYLLDPRFQPRLRALFGGEEPFAVQTMFYFKPPGARGQDLHQDNFYLRVKPGTCLAAWIAVDDADEANGGMLCVPETSNLEIACPEPADPAKFFTTEHVEPPPGKSPVPVDLRAGDVLFFNGNVIHGSYPNTSRDRFRRSLICHYVPASTVELAHWYERPMSFDGAVHKIAVATGGGPCGSLQEAARPH